MPSSREFLVALDDHLTERDLDSVIYGATMYEIASAASLCAAGSEQAAQWTGLLVTAGYVAHGPKGAGDPQPLPPGMWSSHDMQRVSDYRLTGEGRAEAERVRRRQREKFADAAMGGPLAVLMTPSMNEAQSRGLTDPLRRLRTALEGEHHSDAIGAAKDLLEAACRVRLEVAGEGMTASDRSSLPTLFKHALSCSEGRNLGDDLAKSLTATVGRLAELRNDAGAGHGRADQPQIKPQTARLAATAAWGVAQLLAADFGA
jgi:hypothetical protein